MKKELLKGLTKEQIEKIKTCENSNDLLQLAKDEGVELTDEQLNAVSGGCGESTSSTCPKCGSDKVKKEKHGNGFFMHNAYTCKSCGYEWDD